MGGLPERLWVTGAGAEAGVMGHGCQMSNEGRRVGGQKKPTESPEGCQGETRHNEVITGQGKEGRRTHNFNKQQESFRERMSVHYRGGPAGTAGPQEQGGGGDNLQVCGAWGRGGGGTVWGW